MQVCPTGIDIRNGLQMECIACTACADACDAVMTKLEKRPGLVGYASGWKKTKREFTKPVALFAALLLFVSAWMWTLSRREAIAVQVIRKTGAPFQEIHREGLEKEITNHFSLDLVNQSFESVRLDIQGSPPSGVQVISPYLPVDLLPGESRRVDIFLRFPLSRIENGHGQTTLATLARSASGENVVVQEKEVPLVGPLR